MTKFVAQPTSSIAISHSDYEHYGCPVCNSGERKGHSLISTQGATVFCCSSCNVTYIVCHNILTQSPFGVGGEYPDIIPHPLST